MDDDTARWNPDGLPEVTHRSPRPGQSEMPCCGRSPFELPRHHRVTGDDTLVTCRTQDDGGEPA